MTHASVFSGIGGPEVAADMLGWENLFHCEINPFGRKVLDYWYPNSKSYEDITTTDFTEWRGKVNVLTGGFPCQPFSYAGQRRGPDDNRYLWPFMHRCINQVQPDWVVCENVAGILTMVEQGKVSQVESTGNIFDQDNVLRRYRLQETFTLERICNDIQEDGYEVQAMLIPACAVGAPHRRDRVFIIGRRIVADTREEDDERGIPTYTKGIGRNEGKNDNGITKASQQSECRKFKLSGADCPQDRWRDFPTVSPVHRGNDGIPFDVDSLTISFAKWQTEALKAYGNAIVPQVMYEIFRAIEIVHTTKVPHSDFQIVMT